MYTNSEKEVKPGKKGSIFRRWLAQFIRQLGTCCGRPRQAQVPDEFEVRSEDLRRCTDTYDAFQQFLRDRKLEVKQEAAERIASMKSTTGISPLELFPTEIWLEILENFEPECLANMLEIHDLFPDLILEKKELVQDILLPLMLDFKLPIVQKYILRADSDHYQWASKKDELWPLITLRRVCKSFKDGIDRWIENHLLNLMRTFEFVECSGCNTSLTVKELKSFQLDTCHSWEQLSKIAKYSRGPVATRPKRFIKRSLTIEFYCDDCCWVSDNSPRLYDHFTDSHGKRLPERFPLFIDSITEFLQTVGDQILHMSLVLPSETRLIRFGVPLSQADIFDILRGWLTLVPNLKWLQINATIVDAPSSDLDVTRMPLLRKLERFDFQGCVDKKDPIWHAILAANPQISRINVLHSWPPGSYISAPEHYRALGKAELDEYKDPAVLPLALEVAHFKRVSGVDCALSRPVQNNKWNLKRSTVWISGWKQECSMSQVFQCLQTFPTLEDVWIHMDINCEKMRIGEIFLLLPNLKRGKFELGTSWKLGFPNEGDFLFSLMFLLECRKLESLIWVNDWFDSESLRYHMEQDKEGIMIDFKGGFGDLSESNVWDVFPKLRNIMVRSRISPVGVGCETEYYVARKYHDRKLIGEKKLMGRMSGDLICDMAKENLLYFSRVEDENNQFF